MKNMAGNARHVRFSLLTFLPLCAASVFHKQAEV
jgi:hypothetical protein